MFKNDLNLPISPEDFNLVSTLSGRIIYCCSELISYLGVDLTGRNLNDIFPEQLCVDIFQSVRESPKKTFDATLLGIQFRFLAEIYEDEISFTLVPLTKRPSQDVLENTAANISRVISSIMSTILPNYFLVRKTSEQTMSLAVMEKEFMRLFRLSKNIGHYALLQSGQCVINYKAYDICDFMTTLIEQIREAVSDMPITVTLVRPDESYYCNFDKEKIERALLNFLANAFQAITGEGKVEVTLRPLGKDVMSILIRDNGHGCTPAQLAKISRKHADVAMFEGEFRGGAGFGFGIATAFFELHGGNCVMLSTLGKGSILSISLPRNLDKVPPSLSDYITDYAGGYNHIKLELSPILPPEAYFEKSEKVASKSTTH